MERDELPEPTGRELDILKVLWERGEATVREVHEALRDDLPIVQNTVQAFLRTMEEKGLVTHRSEGRAFVYRAVPEREPTGRRLLGRVLDRAFDGALDQLVASALAMRRPRRQDLDRLRQLIDEFEQRNGRGRAT
ncbi:MAG: BlaI/MecI/CopY family transcriptional regulator [Planctomycetes bacterium]|nr:BlaI/MecI/CopY family transcriptional regulator [Planctomycetota bacterium]